MQRCIVYRPQMKFYTISALLSHYLKAHYELTIYQNISHAPATGV
jgi:hypothetical protein